jgi:hypothetical protein
MRFFDTMKPASLEATWLPPRLPHIRRFWITFGDSAARARAIRQLPFPGIKHSLLVQIAFSAVS